MTLLAQTEVVGFVAAVRGAHKAHCRLQEQSSANFDRCGRLAYNHILKTLTSIQSSDTGIREALRQAGEALISGVFAKAQSGLVPEQFQRRSSIR